MKSPQHLYRMKVEINASSRENSWPHSKRDFLADHQEQNTPFSLFFFFLVCHSGSVNFVYVSFPVSICSCPQVPVGGEVEGVNIPGLVVFAIIFGVALQKLGPERALLICFFSSFSDAPWCWSPGSCGKWWKEEHLLLQTRWRRFKFSVNYSLTVWLQASDFLCACFLIYKMGTVL